MHLKKSLETKSCLVPSRFDVIEKLQTDVANFQKQYLKNYFYLLKEISLNLERPRTFGKETIKEELGK